jgi:hypothetical protein
MGMQMLPLQTPMTTSPQPAMFSWQQGEWLHESQKRKPLLHYCPWKWNTLHFWMLDVRPAGLEICLVSSDPSSLTDYH